MTEPGPFRPQLDAAVAALGIAVLDNVARRYGWTEDEIAASFQASQ